MSRSRVRICVDVDCKGYTDGHARCDDCRRAADKQRGRRQARGYGADYIAELKKLKATKPTVCVTCGERFTANNPMTGGHAKSIRYGGTLADGLIPECRHCNLGKKSGH